MLQTMSRRVAESYKVHASLAAVRRWQRRLEYRVTRAADGFPLPPIDLQYLISHIEDVPARDFLNLGAWAVDDMDALLTQAGASLASRRAILDFGCGCGRMLRHLPARTPAKIFGCDYNPTLVDWCQRHLRFAECKVNTLEPPLPYHPHVFDFVYAYSVFTHLPDQRPWFRELARVLQPGGFALVTTLGAQFWKLSLPPHERALAEAGHIVVRESRAAGENICAVFQDGRSLESVAPDFTLVGSIPGEPVILWRERHHLPQDTYLLQRH